MPSFATEVKNELARLSYEDSCCRTAELAALLRMGSTLTFGLRRTFGLNFTTENAAVARKALQLLKAEGGGIKTEITVSRSKRLKKNNSYTVQVPPAPAVAALLEHLGFLQDERQRTLRRLLVPESSTGGEAGGSEETVEGPAEETVDSFREKTTGRGGGPAGKKTDRAGNQKLLVLDAFTKRFAMPGIRLGYLMAADPSVLEAIHAQQAEWSVSLPAQIAGAAALEADNEDYLQKTRTLIARERKKMESALRSMGCRVFPGEANYIFFSCGTELFLPLLSRGILIRQCDNYKGLQKGDYRAAVRLPEENDILLQAMAEILCAGRGAS